MKRLVLFILFLVSFPVLLVPEVLNIKKDNIECSLAKQDAPYRLGEAGTITLTIAIRDEDNFYVEADSCILIVSSLFSSLSLDFRLFNKYITASKQREGYHVF